jgi:DNA-damage-inducible protein J
MAQSSMIHIRVDDDTKAKASEALAQMGLSVSDAVRILLKRIVAEQAFPLELKVPNALTRESMEEARAMARAGGHGRFDSAGALIDELDRQAE